ncbi:MAG TPA: hypothetical protein VM639_03445 [Dongiaceae bacterium]|nr:hypothetical protein [Dongiaceae bacterium]
MSMRDGCDKVLLLQAEFDGELDAAQSIAITRHRESCACCRDAWQRLVETRRTLRDRASYHKASAVLGQRLDQALASAARAAGREAGLPDRGLSEAGHDTRRRPWLAFAPWWRPALGFAAGAAAAAIAILLFFQPLATTEIADLVVASHVRSMQPGHLLDVASNDQHNVKPWFDGKVDFAPPVKNLADQGFPLVGGRLDYLQDRNVAALVYRSGPHLINVLIWPSEVAEGGEPRQLDKGGFNILHWQEGGMVVWVVSDLDAAKLQNFVTIWRNHD